MDLQLKLPFCLLVAMSNNLSLKIYCKNVVNWHSFFFFFFFFLISDLIVILSFSPYIWYQWTCMTFMGHIYIYIYLYLESHLTLIFNCSNLKWVMLLSKSILQHFYKMLMWSTFYWFSSRPTINITFSFTNNHSSHQQFVKKFVKLFVFLIKQ